MTSPRWPYYLPVNPCCTPAPSCSPTLSCCPEPCSVCSCSPCICGDPCANPCHIIGRRTDDMAYNGENLPCTDIDQCDTLTVVLQKIEKAICTLQGLLVPTTTTTSTTTPPVTTTTSTTILDCEIIGWVFQIS